jgi:hypothetical protein
MSSLSQCNCLTDLVWPKDKRTKFYFLSGDICDIYTRLLPFCLTLVALCHFNHQEPLLLWRTFATDHILQSEDGAVATQTSASSALVTTGTELTEGKHYWEVEILSEGNLSEGWEPNINIFFGICRPNLDPTGDYCEMGCTDAWFIHACDGDLFGNGKDEDDEAGGYKQGDRVGVLLNLDNGSLRFFKNGAQHGPGYPAGSVTGPVVHAVQMFHKDTSVRMLPNAEAKM